MILDTPAGAETRAEHECAAGLDAAVHSELPFKPWGLSRADPYSSRR